MKKHEFRFIRVDTKSDVAKPLATERGKALELRDNTGESFAHGKNTTIIYVEGEVRITRALETKLKKREGKNGRKNGRERGTLRGTA